MKMGRRLRCSSVTYPFRYAPSSRLAGGPILIATPLNQSRTWCTSENSTFHNCNIRAFQSLLWSCGTASKEPCCDPKRNA